jgi:hypothetical protein
MAQISKKDLEFLTSEEIKSFYKTENQTQFNISPIMEYIENGKDNYTMGNRINRVEKILNLIVVERFVNGTL